jgi:hypothetical protein
VLRNFCIRVQKFLEAAVMADLINCCTGGDAGDLTQRITTAIDDLKANADKIKTFTNGDETEMVTLGGVPTSTLRKLVYEATNDLDGYVTLAHNSAVHAEEKAAETQVNAANSLNSSTEASSSANAAGLHATSAEASRNTASASATSAMNSESAALTAKNAAEASAGLSEGYAGNASASAGASAASASAAAGSASDAEDSAELSRKWAENPEDTVVADGGYSALHWSLKAVQAAEDAAEDAVAAVDVLMQEYVESAETAATEAASSEANAAASGTAAAASAQSAQQSAEIAGTAASGTKDRGTVVNALTSQGTGYGITAIEIDDGGAGYEVGDALIMGDSESLVDAILVVNAVDGSGAITDISISKSGVWPSDSMGTITISGGHGTGFDPSFAAGEVAYTTLADILVPTLNDTAYVVRDEIHDNATYLWKYADYNGDGQSNWVPITAFAGTIKPASTTQVGITRYATAEEAVAGTDMSSAVTPTGLAACTATDTRKGIVELATSAEVIAGAVDTMAVTPAGLNARTATDARTGLVELATAAEAVAGTDTSRAVTPSGLKAALGVVRTPIILENDTGANTTVSVPEYAMGKNKLLVFAFGQLCDPGTSASNGFYEEVSSTSIRVFEPMPAGTKLTVLVLP